MNCLRTPVSGLKARYELEGYQLELKEAIEGVFKKKPWKYKRPEPDTNRLFEADVLTNRAAGLSVVMIHQN
jgi:hypothetical protein